MDANRGKIVYRSVRTPTEPTLRFPVSIRAHMSHFDRFVPEG